MSDNAHEHTESSESTLASLIDGIQPMGDLAELAIDDLDPDAADEFFRILEDV